MATIKFFLQSKSNPANIYIRIIDGRKVDIKCKTNFVINPDDWSKPKQRPKSLSNVHFGNLDVDLQNLRTNLLNHYNKSNKNIDLVWLKNFINPPVVNEIPTKLVDYFDYYLKQRGNELTHTTVKKIKVVQNKIIKYEKLQRIVIFIENVNIDFKNKFEKYNDSLGYSKNTFYNNLKEIKSICLHAKRKGLTTSLEVEQFKIIQKKAISIYLNFEELDKIESVSDDLLKTENLIATRDWLIISCYTAQRVSDFMKFESSMIRKEKEVYILEFKQKKTNTLMAIPLHKKVIAILEKRNFEFPKKMLDKDYNIFLKKVCSIAGINEIVFCGKNNPATNRKEFCNAPKYEFVSSHIGRRSFATNFYGTIPTALLMKMTGHKTEAMFLIYIGKTNTESAIELNNWF